VVSSLIAVSASLGKGLVVQSGINRQTRGNLYVVIGATSGTGKSEVFRDMLGPLVSFEANLHLWWQTEASPRARAGNELLKAKISGIRSHARKRTPSLAHFRAMQAAEQSRDLCQSYMEPPCLLADDATPEALAEVMSRSHESIAAVSADARYMLKRLSRADSKEENFLLKAFSGDLALTSRVTRRSIRLGSPCLTVFLLTQCDAYRSFMDQAVRNRSGLLPRFLHAEFECSDPLPVSIQLDDARSVRRDYETHIGELIESFRFEDNAAVVTPSSEASAFLRDIEQTARSAAISDDSIRGEIHRRRAEQTWRVALCLHAAAHGRRSAVEQLSIDHARSAAAIVETMAPSL
jgi:hypothetical protein